MKVAAIGFHLLAAAAPLCAQRAPLSPRVALVRQLYSDFACEAVLDWPECDTQHRLVDQPKRILTRYFDDGLATLLVADRACEAKTHEICNMDFSPIWDSQDWSGTYVEIKAAPDSSHVDVTLHSSRSTVRPLRYTLVHTPAGWRIHDIEAPQKWSLVKLLSAKP